MPKALLISYAGQPYTPSSLMPDNGLASLAASLIDTGFEVKIIDYGIPELCKRLIPERQRESLRKVYDSLSESSISNLFKLYAFGKLKLTYMSLEKVKRRVVHRLAEELADLVAHERPNFIGFKLWNGDGFEGAQVMAKKLKERFPSLKLIAGGPHAYSGGSAILKYLAVDALCYDEGELTIQEFARYSLGKTKLSRVPNIFYRDGSNISQTPLEKIIDLDALPCPTYSEDVYTDIGKKMNIYVIDETRGCMFCCPFCIQSSRPDNKFRSKSPQRIVNEMQRLINDKKASYFRFGGQMIPGDLLERIANLILNQGINAKYTCFGHISSMKKADFQLLAASGLVAVFYGVESGSPELLKKAFNKKIAVEDITTVLLKTKKAGIKAVASFIYPAPFETEGTKKETLSLIDEVRPDSVLAYFPGIYPGTVWYKRANKYNFEITTDRYLEEMINYKIINIFPPRFWQPLPYKVNGLPFRKYAAMTEEFISEIRSIGLDVFLSDEHFIISEASGLSPRVLSTHIQRTFFSGDYKQQEELVGKVNQNGTSS